MIDRIICDAVEICRIIKKIQISTKRNLNPDSQLTHLPPTNPLKRAIFTVIKIYGLSEWHSAIEQFVQFLL